MSRNEFGDILQRYLNGQATDAEKKIVEQWYALLDEHPDSQPSLSTQKARQLEARLWQRIRQKASILPHEHPATARRLLPVRSTGWRFGRWAAAATVALVVGLAAYWLLPESSSDTPIGSVVVPAHRPASDEWTFTNTSVNPRELTLPDGSRVTLQPGAMLRYPTRFAAKNREVQLTGEAFFDVQHQPDKPFVVLTGEVVTRVLGTSFTVRALARKRVEVDVRTGRVAVSFRSKPGSPAAAHEVVLTPNHRVVCLTETHQFIQELVPEPNLLPLRHQEAVSLRFYDTPLSEVLTRLETLYGIRIKAEGENLSHCPLTADLTGQPLQVQLDIICAALRATHTVRDTSVLIQGRGCE